MPKKILLIPGWMHSVAFYKKYEGLDIWVDKNEWAHEENPQWVIGHCVGATIALEKFQNNNTKFILVNPMLPRKSFWEWMKSWLAYFFTSGEIILNDKAMLKMNYVRGILKFKETTKIDTMEIIRKIPKENIVVVRGRNDKYFCDDDTVAAINKIGIKIIEVDGVGHGWSEKFDEEINKIIN